MDPAVASRLHGHARERGVNPYVYWIVRAILQPFFHLYFRLSRIGREHVPDEGPGIFAETWSAASTAPGTTARKARAA